MKFPVTHLENCARYIIKQNMNAIVYKTIKNRERYQRQAYPLNYAGKF